MQKPFLATERNRRLGAGLRRCASICLERAGRRFIEYFTANIRKKNTRLAYARVVARFFDWCDARDLRLESIETVIVAAYIEELLKSLAVPSVKQNLAAI